MRHMTTGDRLAQGVNYLLLSLLAASCVLPFLYVISVSLTPISEFIKKDGLVIIPTHTTLTAYREIMQGGRLLDAYQVTLFRVIVGTLLNLVFTVITALPLSRKALPGRSPFLLFIVFTMLFNGGIIPGYLLVKNIGLLDSEWSLIIPGLINAFYLMIVKSFFEQLPEAIDEAARIDGAGEIAILVRIVIPLSVPIIATIGLFYAVWHWNSYFDALLYINTPENQPVQLFLRQILLASVAISGDAAEAANSVNPISVQMASVAITTLPILVVYPFIQKHFTRGVLLGSVKG
ncbi:MULTISPECIES: carbohydrate ABC transporter permease [Paenibacillus]|uniref:ABC transporter permease subunit n=2 Tax=Paenibacillus TaxID=44249 RepID=A0ABX1XEA3_9BACL|nr:MULTISPECIES: carbohydrate ABC transporter permease [Paenibacillus]NOU66817.1 ABC transporter permease subunit [Paenibacillus plantarum]NQX61993.1 carbohydrate ABC transporter permease [Paenibacillus qinlingensis]CAH1216142.1 Melibiose/raffinose/stachyose import permease protein MelC [Paenibacillus allorhizoplanae]